MAEETLVVEENTAPAQQDFTGSFRMSFTPQEFVDLYDTFDEEARKPDSQFQNGLQGFAVNLVESMTFDPYLGERMDYNSLRTGTAPILAELGIEGQGLTDAQIIELFAEDDKGQDIVADPSFYEGVKRRALPSAGFATGFYGGMKAGNIALAGVPPVTIPTAILRVGGPLVTGIIGGMGLSAAGEYATDQMMGEEPIIIPGTKANYEAGKTFADTLPFVITPWAIPKGGINIGGQIAVNNANKFIGPIMQGQSRVPFASKAVAGTEKLISGIRPTTMRGNITTGAVEGVALAGTTFGGREAERIAPDNPWVRFGFEAGYGIGGAFAGDLATRRVPMILGYARDGVVNLYNRAAGNVPPEVREFGMTAGERRDVGNFILEQLEKNGEDPDAVLAALNDPQFDQFLIAPDGPNAGKRVELDPATRAASVTLLSLQNQFIDANPGAYGNDATKRMKDGIDALRRALLALYADGSQTALQDAAMVQTALFEGVLDSKLAAATDRTVKAMQKVRGTTEDAAAGKTIFETLDSQYTAGRADESALWNKIPRDIEVTRFIDDAGEETDVPNFISTFNNLFADETIETKKALLRNDELRFLKEFVERKTSELGLDAADGADAADIIGVNASELWRTRSRALAMGKRLAANDLPEESAIAYKMADALLADLYSFDVGVSQAYDTARSYSRAFNDVFTRAYAGDILGTKKNGALKIPVEVIRDNMMKGDGAYLRAAQLDGVAQFGAQQALTNVLKAEAGEFAEVGEQLLGEFNKLVDPQTQALGLDQMRSWYGANKELINTVPGLNNRIVRAMNTATDLRNAEEVLLRSVRADALNADGTLNTQALSNWMNKASSKQLLELFPAIANDLQDVRKAQYLLKETSTQNKADLAAERAGIGLYELLPDKTSNAMTAVSKAISTSQTRPFAILNRYMKMVDDVGEGGFTISDRNSPNFGQTWTKQELRDGMRKAIYDSIFEVASNGERFSPAAAYNRLFTPHPIAKGETTIADWLIGNDLATPEMMQDTKKFLQKMTEIEVFTMKARPGQSDEFFKDVGEGIKILAAMGGSVGGTQLRQMFGGGGTGDLIAAGRGAKFGEQLANKYMAELPQSMQAGRVQKVLENEKLLRLVLETGRTEREKATLGRQLAAAFANSYIVDPSRRLGGEAIQETFSFEGDPEGSPIPPVNDPTENGANMPATVDQTAPVNQAPPQPVPVNPSRPPIQAPPPPPQPEFQNPSRFDQGSVAPASGAVDRTKFAALFPEDRELLGIGSLMGQG